MTRRVPRHERRDHLSARRPKIQTMAHRPWLNSALDAFNESAVAHYYDMPLDAVDVALHQLIANHEQFVDRECVNLYAGTNMPNPRVSAVQASSIGSRPNLGYPGDKYNKGMRHAEQIELMLTALLRKLFNAQFVEHRVASGSIANLYAYMALTKPGDDILVFSDAAAGHATHHDGGAAGLYGLKIHEMAFDTGNMDVDLDGLAGQIEQLNPKLLIVAGSMCLFPYNVRAVRALADRVGAYVMYDAAHMGGLIAGGVFQQPLAEGAHVMTGSTYKSFGGPAAGMLLTNEPALAERIERIAFPGLSANFDLGKTAAMVLATLDQLAHGTAYAKQMQANAVALAQALHDQGVPVFHMPAKGFTASQHVALEAWTLGGGNAASARIEAANILMSGIGLPGPTVTGDYNGIRLGTQEITRWGMAPADMPALAALIARVFVAHEDPTTVRTDVMAFRSRFQTLTYVR
jgi:glycine hydroxymethyltransferase